MNAKRVRSRIIDYLKSNDITVHKLWYEYKKRGFTPNKGCYTVEVLRNGFVESLNIEFYPVDDIILIYDPLLNTCIGCIQSIKNRAGVVGNAGTVDVKTNYIEI